MPLPDLIVLTSETLPAPGCACVDAAAGRILATLSAVLPELATREERITLFERIIEDCKARML